MIKQFETELGGRTLRFEIGKLAQHMIREGETCSEAEFTIALFDLAARKLVAPTEEWLAAVGLN